MDRRGGEEMNIDIMDSQFIKNMLAEKYKKLGHSIFIEFRTATGYNYARYIDMVAVGLYHKNAGIKSFEIKVSRADFLNDVRQFNQKHEDAIEISNEFYYICPWNLIDKGEVPEISGLLYIDKGNGIKTIKQAQFRKKLEIPVHHFQAFMKFSGNKIDNTLIPVRWLGKDISQKDIDKEFKNRSEGDFDFRVEQKVRELTEERDKDEDNCKQLIRELRTACGFHYSKNDEECFEKIKSFCEIGREIFGYSNLTDRLGTVRDQIEKIQELINKKEKKCDT